MERDRNRGKGSEARSRHSKSKEEELSSSYKEILQDHTFMEKEHYPGKESEARALTSRRKDELSSKEIDHTASTERKFNPGKGSEARSRNLMRKEAERSSSKKIPQVSITEESSDEEEKGLFEDHTASTERKFNPGKGSEARSRNLMRKEAERSSSKKIPQDHTAKGSYVDLTVQSENTKGYIKKKNHVSITEESSDEEEIGLFGVSQSSLEYTGKDSSYRDDFEKLVRNSDCKGNSAYFRQLRDLVRIKEENDEKEDKRIADLKKRNYEKEAESLGIGGLSNDSNAVAGAKKEESRVIVLAGPTNLALQNPGQYSSSDSSDED